MLLGAIMSDINVKTAGTAAFVCIFFSGLLVMAVTACASVITAYTTHCASATCAGTFTCACATGDAASARCHHRRIRLLFALFLMGFFQDG